MKWKTIAEYNSLAFFSLRVQFFTYSDVLYPKKTLKTQKNLKPNQTNKQTKTKQKQPPPTPPWGTKSKWMITSHPISISYIWIYAYPSRLFEDLLDISVHTDVFVIETVLEVCAM